MHAVFVLSLTPPLPVPSQVAAPLFLLVRTIRLAADRLLHISVAPQAKAIPDLFRKVISRLEEDFDKRGDSCAPWFFP